MSPIERMPQESREKKESIEEEDSGGEWGMSKWTIHKHTYLQENKLTGEENKEDGAIYIEIHKS